LDLGLRDKIVVVTGGGRGIGAAVARACATEGAIPVIIERDDSVGQTLQTHLRNLGGHAELITVDVCDPKNCRQAIQLIEDSFGRIDALVNNAGQNDRIGLEHGSPETFLESLSRNLLHYYYMAHYSLPLLKRSKGTIVNIGSKTAVTGQGGTSGYACSKGGIMALTREWAVELRQYGIRVNAVIPAEVMTPMYAEWIQSFSDPEEKLKDICVKIPLGRRMTTAEEIAATTVFLISDKSGHTTGQHIFVDGGYTHLDRALS
jgi:L-fucose dehydrogenase